MSNYGNRRLEGDKKGCWLGIKIVALTTKISVFDGGWFYRINIAVVVSVKDVSVNDANDFTERFTFLYLCSHL